jgi:hypothetical protein
VEEFLAVKVRPGEEPWISWRERVHFPVVWRYASMNATQTGHLYTKVGEHIAKGEFRQDTDCHGMFQAEGDYPDVRSNVLYELNLEGGATVNLFEVHKDPNDWNHVYHLKLKPQAV